jgi:hypothetical protein
MSVPSDSKLRGSGFDLNSVSMMITGIRETRQAGKKSFGD